MGRLLCSALLVVFAAAAIEAGRFIIRHFLSATPNQITVAIDNIQVFNDEYK
jgi:hypothetical protein